MYIMHENVSFYFQWSLHVELPSTYLQTWCTRLTLAKTRDGYYEKVTATTVARGLDRH